MFLCFEYVKCLGYVVLIIGVCSCDRRIFNCPLNFGLSRCDIMLIPLKFSRISGVVGWGGFLR